MSDLRAILAAHDARVTELLRANNAEVERRRAAEARVAELEAALAQRQNPVVPVERLLIGPGTFALPMTPAERHELALLACLIEDRLDWDAAQR